MILAHHSGFIAFQRCRLGEELKRCCAGCATYIGRVLANFCARGAPKYREFYNFFARFRRKVCVISTPDARLFGCQRTHDLVKSFKDVMRVAAHVAGRLHETFCARGAPNFFRNFAILSRDFGATFALLVKHREALVTYHEAS